MGGPGSGSKPKQYPSDLVESVRRLYVDRGMSQVEVADALATTQKVIYNLMRRHNISRRRQVKREQAGSANSTWRGDEAGYAALHSVSRQHEGGRAYVTNADPPPPCVTSGRT